MLLSTYLAIIAHFIMPVSFDKIIYSHGSGIVCVACSECGRYLASGDENGTVIIWNITESKLLAKFEDSKNGAITALSFSNDSKIICIGTSTFEVLLFDVKSQRPVGKFDALNSAVTAIVMSNNGQYIYTGQIGVKIWNAKTFELEKTFKTKHGSTNGIVLTSDNKRLFTCGANKIIQSWDASNGEGLISFVGHENVVTCLAINSKQDMIVSGSSKLSTHFPKSDSSIRVWNVCDAKCVAILNGHKDTISDVRFFPKYNTIFSSSWDGSIKIWNMSTGSVLQSISVSNDRLNMFCIAPDGGQLFTVGSDRKVKQFCVNSYFFESAAKRIEK